MQLGRSFDAAFPWRGSTIWRLRRRCSDHREQRRQHDQGAEQRAHERNAQQHAHLGGAWVGREHHAKIRRLLSFSRKYPNLDVVDPYYGGAHGFEENLDMIEDAVRGLIREITGESRVKMRPGA
jgi:protein-tyrosine-phosphatase